MTRARYLLLGIIRRLLLHLLELVLPLLSRGVNDVFLNTQNVGL